MTDGTLGVHLIGGLLLVMICGGIIYTMVGITTDGDITDTMVMDGTTMDGTTMDGTTMAKIIGTEDEVEIIHHTSMVEEVAL
jgi:hypothetical protein